MAQKIKRLHEFRDPIHDFITVNRQARLLVDSEPFQRLRHIHQLALTFLVYPGASHKRFEHSLGVMHLAGKAFDVVTDEKNIHPEIEHIVPDRDNFHYWRTVLTLAALCHDIGHIPFSHAGERHLLPKGENHESLTLALIESDYLKPALTTGFHVQVEHVKKLAVGKKKLKSNVTPFTDWEAILSEIIVGDALGVDRIDYLLRDSYHLGVSYGRFDHVKLIDSLRLLPKSLHEEESKEPVLGVDEGGLHSAEALLLARYFMYEQVYFHDVRRIYDSHLIDFMKLHYGNLGYPLDVESHLKETDNEVFSSLRRSVRDTQAVGHDVAKIILSRGHYRTVYSRNPTDELFLKTSIENGKIIPELNTPISPAYYLHKVISKHFDSSKLKSDLYIESSNPNVFPVLMNDDRVESSVGVSAILANIPPTTVDFIFASPDIAPKVRSFIEFNREAILSGSMT